MSPERKVADNPTQLVCEVCGIEAEDRAVGWMALLRRDDDDQVSVALMCPLCVAGEFEMD